MLPQGWDRRSIVLLTFALLFVIAANHAQAQVFDLERDRVQMAELNGLWRFHTGDDPDGKLGWANPNFDDSSWKLLRSDQHVNMQGFPSYSGMAWYRFRVLLPANHPPLALYIPGIGTSYQVFAGGRVIGQFGGLPPHERAYLSHSGGSIDQTPRLGQVISIPDGMADGTVPLVIAIRVWTWPEWASLLDTQTFQPLSIGDANIMNDERQHRWNYLFWSLSAENALAFGYLLAALAGLGLFLLRRREREYLWFAGFAVFDAAGYFWDVCPSFHPVWFQGYMAVFGLLLLLGTVCLPVFLVTLLKQPRGWLYWTALCSAMFAGLMYLPLAVEWMSVSIWLSVIFFSIVPFIVCQLLILSLAAKRGNLDARLLLGPFGLQYGLVLGGGIITGLDASGHGGPALAFWAAKWQQLFLWPFPISGYVAGDFVFQLSILAILVLRFARTRRDEERFKGELEAARTVQQVLIPEEIPTIPGLAIECVYKPASQVGGDFFQVLPVCEGCALTVIGDVSGKGMPAAMAVSLLVGTVRTLAHYTQSPAEILTAMNHRMLGRSKGGFTTCLVLRLDQDGSATVANAGHLAPYLGATEVPVEGGLPLGLAAQAEYTESNFHLDTGGEITLVTDGVAEARAKTGELFGFERAASIAILSAAQIAATAAAFGQQDDITVLKIRRQPVSEPALASPTPLPSASPDVSFNVA